MIKTSARALLLASSITLMTTGAAKADELIDAYNAYIGQDDLYNSRGVRLSEPWQVIRQDRANYYKFGIHQPGDEPDRFFASVNNRAKAERMVRSGMITHEAGRRLLSGDRMINVKIYRSRSGDYLSITVY